MSAPDSVAYHLSISPTTGAVKVAPIGMDCIDSSLGSYYSSVGDMPDWVQRKLATLMMLTPPHDVVGVGSRVGTNLYWVYE